MAEEEAEAEGLDEDRCQDASTLILYHKLRGAKEKEKKTIGK